MRATVRAVARPSAAAGLRLAGVPVDDVATLAEGARRALALASRPDVGVLLVEEELLSALPDSDRVGLLDGVVPVVVPFPSPRIEPGGTPADRLVTEILQRAVGYRVRLR